MTEETGGAAPDTMMERLRAKSKAAAAVKTFDLPLPGYGGELVARYKLLDPLTDGKSIGDRIRAQFPNDEAAQQYYAFADSLITACEGFYVMTEKGLELLNPDGAGPIKYADPRLMEFLELDAGDPPSARGALLAVFSDNKVAISAQGSRLARWMADPAGDSLGEG